jgi:hypothetical protein
VIGLFTLAFRPTFAYTHFGLECESLRGAFLPKQSNDFQKIASLRNARNDSYKITLYDYIILATPKYDFSLEVKLKRAIPDNLRNESITLKPFSPAWWAAGGHLQTLAGYLLPSPAALPEARWHRIAVSEGDAVVMAENLPTVLDDEGAGMVLLLHGLGGHADSPYMRRLATKFLLRNCIAFRLNHRGAGQGRGLAKHLYHAGRGEDLSPVLSRMARLHPKKAVVAVGFSLSGNMLLKYLGEKLHPIPQNLCGAIAICPPVKLALSAAAISRKSNRLYDFRFIRLLEQGLREREQDFSHFPHFDFPWDLTVYRFDQMVTAPLSGFSSAEDYYEKCSAFQFLANIKLPAVILASQNDPFIPKATFADLPANEFLQLHFPRSGGHLGFISSQQTRFGDRRWMDEAIVDWAKRLVKGRI